MRVAVVAALVLAIAGVAPAAPEVTRRPAPPAAGVTLDGKRVSLASMRGKPVFINVWSSW